MVGLERSNERQLGSVRSARILIVILVLLVLAAVRLYPVYQYSLEPDSYKGLQAYRLNHLIDSGHALPSERGEVLLDKLDVIRMLVATLPSEFDLLAVSLVQSLVLMLCVLLFYRHYSKRVAGPTFGLSLVVLVFAASASPDIIAQLAGWNGPYAWIFILLFLYFSLAKSSTFTSATLSLTFLLIVPLTYFTMAMMLFIVMLCAPVYSVVTRRGVFSRTLILCYLIFFLAWLLYMSISAFGTVVRAGDLIKLAFRQESRIYGLNNVLKSSTGSVVENAISYSLAYVPLAYVFHDRNRLGTNARGLLGIFALAFLPVVLGLFSWMGIVGVIQRVPYLIVLVAILFFSIYAGARLGPWLHLESSKKILVITAVLAVFFSSYAHLASDYSSAKITFSEADGIEWLSSVSTPESPMFTDLRLSGPFAARGYDPVIINDESLPPNEVNRLLDAIFYGNGDPMEALRELRTSKGQQIEFLFFSESYTNHFPGIKGYDYNFKSAPADFMNRYRNSVDFALVYSNGQVAVFKTTS